jgi:anion-transporting  ArsA/GET3 family ATPase
MKSGRLLVITGKGGVGKSTVAAALGIAASRRGLRTILVEIAARMDIPRLMGASVADVPREAELASDLSHISIEPGSALQEYLHSEVPGWFAGAILSRSRRFEVLAMAAPGLRELVMDGKVWELAQRPRRGAEARAYDLVILDGPASGHALGLLAAPRTFSSIAGVGPIARQAAAIDRMLCDPRSTSVLAVAAPEQTAVSETLELRAALSQRIGIALAGVIVNGLFPARFSGAEARALARADDDPAVRSARWFAGRARAQRAHRARLRRGLTGVPQSTLPYLFSADVGLGELQRLAERLGRWLP